MWNSNDWAINTRVDMQHCGERESNGLAATSLGYCDHVASTQRHRPTLTLDRCWGREALCTDGSHQILRETDFIEGGDGSWDIAALDLYKLLEK